MTKFCPKCSLEKTAEDFNKKTESPDGLAACCRSCVSSYNKELYAKNKEGVLRRRNERRREIAETERKYLKTERGRLKSCSKSSAYRARKKRAFVESVDFSLLFSESSFCAYCETTETLSVDHVVPLSRGGLHEVGNLVVACRSCNSSKKDRLLSELPLEWFEQRGCLESVQK